MPRRSTSGAYRKFLVLIKAHLRSFEVDTICAFLAQCDDMSPSERKRAEALRDKLSELCAEVAELAKKQGV